jgi:hypothetical protein
MEWIRDPKQTEGWRCRDDGQGTVEYVLVILAAAAMATALITWIGGTELITDFFSTVVERLIGSV